MCFHTPRFSYRCPETTVRHVPATPLVLGWCMSGGSLVRAGWVVRVDIPVQYPPSHPARCSRSTPEADSEAGPGSPRGWSGWSAGCGRTWCSAAGTGISPPSGPGQSGQPAFPGIYPRNAASGPIWRDLGQYTRKLVKTAKCRPKITKRPVIVPVSYLASRSHLLNFPDFRIRQPSLTRN